MSFARHSSLTDLTQRSGGSLGGGAIGVVSALESNVIDSTFSGTAPMAVLAAAPSSF